MRIGYEQQRSQYGPVKNTIASLNKGLSSIGNVVYSVVGAARLLWIR